MDRHRWLRGAFCLSVCTLVWLPASLAETTTGTGDAFVKGVTDFVLDRANDNYLYVFQRKLEKNALLNKHLPATLRMAKAGDLRSLITHKDLWKTALKKDLEETRLFRIVDENFVPLLKQLCATAGSTPKPLDAELKALCDKAEAAKGAPTTDKLEALVKAGDALKQKSAAGAAPAPTEAATTEFLAIDKLRAFKDLLGRIEQAELAESCREVKQGKGYTACAIAVLAILEALAHADYIINCPLYGNWCWNKVRTLPIKAESDDFDDFRRFVLFFAQLADVADGDDPKKVTALLKSVTIPAVSFGIKREPHRTRVLVTAYAGGGWAVHTENRNQFMVAAPIGVEISQARDSGNSLSLLLSPVDFGYPLSLKLNGSDTSVRAADVIIPGAYVFWGLKNYPLAIGAGYARVKRVDNPDRREGRATLLFAFDMPLFRLY